MFEEYDHPYFGGQPTKAILGTMIGALFLYWVAHGLLWLWTFSTSTIGIPGTILVILSIVEIGRRIFFHHIADSK